VIALRFVNKWSYGCANYLTKQLGQSNERRRVYYYGFQVVIGAIVKFILLLIVSLLLGVFKETFFTMLFFVTLRVIAGGYHMKTYDKCVYVSLASFVLAGLVVHFLNPFMTWIPSVILTAITYPVALYVIIRWAPRDNPNRPIKSPDEIKKFKTLSLIHIHLWLVLMIVLILTGQFMFLLSGCFGILFSVFVVSPAGHKFFGALSSVLDGKKKIPRKLSDSI